jgi:diacylglycerol kinase family enzyme
MPIIKVILNPVSGRGAGQRTAEVIRQTLTEAQATFDIVETTEQLSAVAQAAQAVREGWDIIAAVGGDGLANEVLNGIIEASLGTPAWEAGEPAAAALGLIPIGTGNDFAWSMGVPIGDVATACRVLAAGQARVVDIGRVEDELANVRYFCNNFGAGFGAATTVESYKLRYLRHGISRDEAIEAVGIDWVESAERQHEAMMENLSVGTGGTSVGKLFETSARWRP